MSIKGRKSKVITLDDILNVVSEVDILHYYFNIQKLPCRICSPFRKEKNPSFAIKSPDGFKVIFRDFANGFKGDVFTLLQEYFGKTFTEVLEMVSYDLTKVHKSKIPIIANNQERKIKTTKVDSNKEMLCKTRAWRQHDIDYWESYGISYDFLVKSNTYPISYIFIIDEEGTKRIPAEKYAYVYVEFKDGVTSYKFYQPFSKKIKWLSKHDASVFDLWTLLPETGENLIITSSRKDAMCIWCNTNIPSTSLQCESYLPKKQVVAELKRRFKNVYVLYDNDFNNPKNPGRTVGQLLAKEFDLKFIEIPTELQVKDSSDLYKEYGAEQLINTINQLIINNK